MNLRSTIASQIRYFRLMRVNISACPSKNPVMLMGHFFMALSLLNKEPQPRA